MESDKEIDVLRNGSDVRLDLDRLAEILFRPEVVDKPVAIVGIGGKWTNAEWIGDDDRCLDDGFAWRGGPHPHTKGIRFWNGVFNIPLCNGDELPVLLFDTQGLFEPGATKENNTKLFVLSVMLCSHLLLNIPRGIDERELESLEFFTEYAKEVKGKYGESSSYATPFQNLTFLVRDWQYPDDHPYGADGGHSYLSGYLRQTKQKESDSVRTNIRSSFKTLEGFLMPHPGKSITSRQFGGRNGDIEVEFRVCVEELARTLFDQTALESRCYNKRPLTGKEIWSLLKACDEAFENNEVPRVENMLWALAITTAQTTRDDAYEKFKEKFKQDTESASANSDMDDKYAETLEYALQIYDTNTTLCTDELKLRHRMKLIIDCQNVLISYSKWDELRKVKASNVSDQILNQSWATYKTEMREVLRTSEVSDDVLETLHRQNIQEALRNYQEGAAPEAAVHDDHVKLLEKYITESHDKFKEMNNRRQHLAVISDQEGLRGDYEATLFMHECIDQFEMDMEKFSGLYIDEEKLKIQISELQENYLNAFDDNWVYEWPEISPFRENFIDFMEKECGYTIKCNSRSKVALKRILQEALLKAEAAYYDTMSKITEAGYCKPVDLSKAHDQTRQRILDCVDDELKEFDDNLKQPFRKEIDDYMTSAQQEFSDRNSKNTEQKPTSRWMDISPQMALGGISAVTMALKRFNVAVQRSVQVAKTMKQLVPSSVLSVSAVRSASTLYYGAVVVGVAGTAAAVGVTAYCVYRYRKEKAQTRGR